jgi:hypothetical protein
MLKISVADPDPVPFFDPGSGMKKIRIRGSAQQQHTEEVGPPFLNIDGLEAGGPNGFLHVARGEGALLAHNPVDFCSHTNSVADDLSNVGTGTVEKSVTVPQHSTKSKGWHDQGRRTRAHNQSFGTVGHISNSSCTNVILRNKGKKQTARKKVSTV